MPTNKPDYQFSGDLDLAAIKKKLEENAKDFDKYASRAEAAFVKVEKAVAREADKKAKAEEKAAERSARAAERAAERQVKAAERAAQQQAKAAEKLAQQATKVQQALDSVGRLGGGKVNVNRLDKETVELQNALKTLGKTGEFEIKKLGKEADNAGGRFQGMVGKITAVTAAIGALAAGAATLKELGDASAELETANFNLAASATAANQEFGDSVGNLESWRDTLKEVGDEVKIFSDRELANAGSRLIDMTKRLGFTEDQMGEILRRSADVGAGKFGIEDTIERVSAALRGEAEAAEALGLTLSETAVKQYAEQHGLVFKELTEGEKAQARYQLLLEQTNQVVGRAAQFAKTQAGEQAKVSAEIENSKALIGEQLLPLYQGWANLVSLVATENEEGVGIIQTVMAGLLATLLTVAVGFETWKNSAISAISVVSAGIEAAKNFENPFTAMSEELDRTRTEAAGFGEFLKDIPGTFSNAFNQITDGWKKQREEARKAGESVGGLPPIYGEVGEAAEEAAVSAEDYEEALKRVQEAQDKFNTDKARDELDALIKAERATADAALDAARKREDIAKKNLQKIADIQKGYEQAVSNAGLEAERSEEDAARDTERTMAQISRDQAQKQVDIARQAAQKKLDIETAYRRKVQDIVRKFSIAALDAERERDAVAFLAAKRDKDLGIEEAGIERGRSLQDLGTETGRQQEEAGLEAERAREEARANAEIEREEAAIANERKLEDLRAQLELELEEQRLNHERELEEQQIAEERKAEDLKLAQEREAEDRALANERKKADLEKSLADELALVKQFEGQKTSTFTAESERRIAQAKKEAEQMRQLSQQSASGATATGNPRTGGGVRRFAEGGNFMAGETIMVGDGGGPELVQFPRAGTVIPNHKIASHLAMLGRQAAGGQTYNDNRQQLGGLSIPLATQEMVNAETRRVVQNTINATLLDTFKQLNRRR